VYKPILNKSPPFATKILWMLFFFCDCEWILVAKGGDLLSITLSQVLCHDLEQKNGCIDDCSKCLTLGILRYTVGNISGVVWFQIHNLPENTVETSSNNTSLLYASNSARINKQTAHTETSGEEYLLTYRAEKSVESQSTFRTSSSFHLLSCWYLARLILRP
jgi:hypothetical protein